MKLRHKWLAAGLALLLTAGTTMGATAAETAALRITNQNERVSMVGHTYAAYKVMDLSKAGTAYAYTIDPDFDGYFTAKGITGPVGGKTRDVLAAEWVAAQTDMQAFSRELLAYLTAADPAMAPDGQAAGQVAATGGEEAVIEGLPLGYYLVVDEGNPQAENPAQAVVAALALQSCGEQDIVLKADAPTIDKVIVEDNTEKRGTTAHVGDTVAFRVTSQIPDLTGYTAYTFVVTDTLSAGLTFGNDVALTIGGRPVTDFTVSQTGQVVTIDLGDLVQKGYAAGADVVLDYTAVLNETAQTTDEETNTVKLTYSNNPQTGSTDDTPEKTVYVYNFDVVLDKYALNREAPEERSHKLAGARFALYRLNGAAREYYRWDEATQSVTWVGGVDVTKTGSEREAELAKITVVTTDSNGWARFAGVEAGSYRLTEISAPAGYQQLAEDIVVEITAVLGADGTLKESNTQKTGGRYVLPVQVANSTGTVLPGTGGRGAAVFYGVGAALMALAAVVFAVTQKRRTARR